MFETALAEAQDAIGTFLTDRLATLGEDRVAEGMRYASDGGKRLRGFLVLETAGMFGVPRAQALFSAAAVECVHAYSLVHDDLPCMDDDDLRRGRPTVHRKWDEATAVLVGDALQCFAFELLADPEAGDAAQRVDLVSRRWRGRAGRRAWCSARRRTSPPRRPGVPWPSPRSPSFRATRPAA
jgi:farnesyl diphosphate synthase